ncbi:MAG: filamentous hemagglutinin N-terminal domain-containing protein [Mariprofundaceae bacterium]|nr:filamentous hemagglutinin N-terminal domain-containing protein [Mariprofundaceae bacterium]
MPHAIPFHLLKTTLMIVLLLLTVQALHAEAIYDGSMGAQGQLSGNFIVPASAGQTQGNNLFHSFSDFHVRTGESATFQGASTIQNVISRVTGGTSSTIDGSIDTATAMPNANFYFVNPAGVIFNSNAFLSVGKSIHISTANFLRMADNQQFFSTPQAGEVLSASAPQSFGFLANNIGYLQLNAAQINTQGLETLSLTASNIQLQNTSLSTPNGHIDIASVASTGEITRTATNNLDTTSFQQMGNINLLNSQVSSSGTGGGSIFIRGGQFVADNSDLSAESFGTLAGGNMNISVDNMLFSNGSSLFGVTNGTARGTDISIQATQDISFSGLTSASTKQKDISLAGIYLTSINTAVNAGDAGNLQLNAQNISFQHGAAISANSWGGGNGGDVNINATTNVVFSGPSSYIEIGPHSLLYAGQTGILTINSDTTHFKNGATIQAGSYGLGQAGAVILNSTQAIQFSGQSTEYDSSGIVTGTFGTIAGAGNGGLISIQTMNLSMADGAYIIANTIGAGHAGDIGINASNLITLQGTNGFGLPTLIGSSTNATTAGIIGGNAGLVLISANQLELLDGARIVSSAVADVAGTQVGTAGYIIIKTTGLLRIDGSNPYGQYDGIFGSALYSRTNSNGGSIKGSGYIQVNTGSLELSNGGVISANTNTNTDAGFIDITSPLISFSGSASNTGLLTTPNTATLTKTPSFLPSSPIKSVSSGIYADSVHSSNGGNSGYITITGQKIIMDNSIISSSSSNTGFAGDVNITGSQLFMKNMSSIRTSSSYTGLNAGNAGWISLNFTDEVRMQSSSKITTESVNSGGGGITLNTTNILRMEDSTISSNVAVGGGNGGDINIDPLFVVLNNSTISANAFAGAGGNITVVANNFLQSTDSRISASSALGINGNINIDSPNINIAQDLEHLPARFMDTQEWSSKVCRSDNQSSFVIQQGEASAYTSSDWQPSNTFNPALTAPQKNTVQQQKKYPQCHIITSI